MLCTGLALSTVWAKTSTHKAPVRKADPIGSSHFPSKTCEGDTAVKCWNDLAVSLASQGKLEEARQAMEAAFQTDPKLATLRSNLELLYGRLASEAYDSALELPPARKELTLTKLPKSEVLAAKHHKGKSEATAKDSALADASALQNVAQPKPKRRTRQQIRDSLKALAAVQKSATPATAVRPDSSVASKDSIPAKKSKKRTRQQIRDSLKALAAVQKPATPAAFVRPDSSAASKDSVPAKKPKKRTRQQIRDSLKALAATQKSTKSAATVRPDSSVSSKVDPVIASAAPLSPPPFKLTPLPQPRNRRTLEKASKAKLKDDTLKVEVKAALEAWAARWAAKDVEGYLACYDTAFHPSNGMTRVAWDSLRRERISAPKSIEIKLESVRFEVHPDGHMISSFLQTYHTEAMRLRSRKRIEWTKISDGTWKIFSEGEVK